MVMINRGAICGLVFLIAIDFVRSEQTQFFMFVIFKRNIFLKNEEILEHG
jgi:hypothetical protein